MKKFLTLILAVCLMACLPLCAMASEVVQDELPPILVVRVGANGERIGAQIYDAQGNLVAEIADDGSLVLTDVHHRSLIEDPVSSARLEEAYENVMENVHHSDVECLLHDHDLKVDINTILRSLGKSIDAHDLVMYEMFNVDISNDMEAKLTDGGYMELTLEVKPGQSTPLITMFTPDGENWQVLPTVNDGNRFTVQLSQPGSLALLCDGTVYANIGKEEKVEYSIPGTDGGADSVDNFTPSVSGKSAPQMKTFVGADGQVLVAYIRNDSGSVEVSVPNRNYIQLTSVAERNYVTDIQAHEHLEWSYDTILEAKDVGELYTSHDMSVKLEGHEHQTLAGALDQAMTQMGLDLTHDQLVVKDLFEVTAYGDYLHLLYPEDSYLDVTFEAALDPSKPLVVIHSSDSVHWHVHPIEETMLNPDGTVTLHMYDLGVVAFLVPAEENVNMEDVVLAP